MRDSMIERVLAAFWGKVPKCDLMGVTDSAGGCSAFDPPQTMCRCRAVMLTLAGHVVYALSMHGRQAGDVGKPESLTPVTDEQKIVLDLAHLAKIEESDAILVLNVGGYTGDSTKREIAWAKMRGKIVYWLQGESNHAHASALLDGAPLAGAA